MQQQQIDITKMSITELKVLAYDTHCQVNLHTNNLRVVEAEIAKRMEAAAAVPQGPPGPTAPAGPGQPVTQPAPPPPVTAAAPAPAPAPPP